MNAIMRAILHNYFALDGYENVQRSHPHLIEEAEKKIRRILSHAEAAGWKLVPVEPSKEQRAAGAETDIRGDDGWVMIGEAGADETYRAMLSAAPRWEP